MILGHDFPFGLGQGDTYKIWCSFPSGTFPGSLLNNMMVDSWMGWSYNHNLSICLTVKTSIIFYFITFHYSFTLISYL